MNNNYIKEQGILDRFIKFHKSRNIEDKDLKNVNMIMHPQNSQINNSPLMNNLTSIVEKMLPKIVEPLKRILRKYSDVSGLALTILEDEFMFYAKFIELEKRITQAGMNCCSGEISDNETSFTELYNIKLGMCYLNDDIQNDIVSNDLDFMNDHQILILTGANRGGKTVFTQGIGLAFLLFQHGLFVPCKSCKLQLCDGIYTHFPVDENHTVSLGRLGEEAKRFNYICMNATKNSLLLLNESFATTSHSESLYIATDAVKYLCCLGARTCYNTHMHELAENLDELYKTQNAVCKAVSVVMGSGDNMRSYMIHFSKPNGKSYAHDIAYKFGITFEQLCQMNRK
ncbi:MAG: hypothetical protein GX896_06255 [Clostridiales bacterium]|nr:hypothetical protein [Clostridiales bacterium]